MLPSRDGNLGPPRWAQPGPRRIEQGQTRSVLVQDRS